ncbi:RDD family protein [Nocardioides aquiterrae]|uniref:RDD domain-containing protein n=1 Tax=Nocardioides aquiterrae TaxID=203799 RepID=A0ABN1UBF5_9ACTN
MSGNAPPPPDQPQSFPPPPAPPGVPRPGELLERFLARLIDGVILGVTFGIVAGVISAVFNGYLYWFLTAVISSVGYLAYFTILESSRGATIGKQVLKLRVFGPDGTSLPTQEQALRRNIWTAFGIAGVVPIVGSLIGGLASLVAVIMIAVNISSDPVNRQGWHDRFAGGTRVVKIG